MKILPHGLILSASLLVMSGCASSQAARIQEKSAVYQALPAHEQEFIRAGKVKVGYTADMVYMALGKPRITTVSTPNGPMEDWFYSQYIPSNHVTRALQSKPTTPGDPWAPKPVPIDRAVAVPDVPQVFKLELLMRGGRVVAMKLDPAV